MLYIIPWEEFEFFMDLDSPFLKNSKLDKTKQTILFCASEVRSALATKTLKDKGHKKVSHVKSVLALMKAKGIKINQ